VQTVGDVFRTPVAIDGPVALGLRGDPRSVALQKKCSSYPMKLFDFFSTGVTVTTTFLIVVLQMWRMILC